MEYNERYIEQIAIERAKALDRAIVGEIQEIALEHGIEKKIVLNEDFIVSALNKQIPKKPVSTTHNLLNGFSCPNCGLKILFEDKQGFITGNKQRYCDNCGQKIDWS